MGKNWPQAVGFATLLSLSSATAGPLFDTAKDSGSTTWEWSDPTDPVEYTGSGGLGCGYLGLGYDSEADTVQGCYKEICNKDTLPFSGYVVLQYCGAGSAPQTSCEHTWQGKTVTFRIPGVRHQPGQQTCFLPPTYVPGWYCVNAYILDDDGNYGKVGSSFCVNEP